MEDQLLYWVWLNLVTGVGAIKAKKLIDNFGNDPINIWGASKKELSSLSFLRNVDISNLLDQEVRYKAKRTLDSLYRNNISVIPIFDELYPENLKSIYDPPILLYKRGSLRTDEIMVAVVGSRKATQYGISQARTISYHLAKHGITVVSGMARGVDAFSHKGALEGDGRTIAVLGCGVDVVYPYENKDLMQDIIGSGAVISEYAPGIRPISNNFPARNRIISGLSIGVLVVEAGDNSGSLITADFALDQGREVFAVPGNVNNLGSAGPNKLIKEGAKLVTNIDDILEEIKHLSGKIHKECTKSTKMESSDFSEVFNRLDASQKIVVEQLKLGPLHVDQLIRKNGLGSKFISAILLELEIGGIVESLPGKIFMIREDIFF